MSMYISTAVRRQGRQGDFLGIGSALGKGLSALGKIGGLVPIPGAGIAGKVAGSLGGIISRTGGALSTIPNRFPFPAPMKLPLLPGGGAGFFQGGGTGTALACVPKSGWPTNKNGTPRRTKRNGCPYKRPTMNFANGRAIKRAARRLEGAEKLFRRVFSIRHGKSAGHITPKGKGRR